METGGARWARKVSGQLSKIMMSKQEVEKRDRRANGRCLVCGGSPTVKSHIVPRALFHAMTRPGHQLVGPRTDGPGYTVLQSGAWSDAILCSRHEAQLGHVDRYGVALCLDFMAKRDARQHPIELPNPQPALLVAFASACVWRMAAARTEGRPERWLGPYAKRLSNALFDNGSPFDAPLLLSRHAYQVRAGETMNMGVLPHPYSELGIRFWRFVACGLIFDLKMDNRAVPYAMSIFPVNQRESISLYDDLPQDPMRSPALGSSLRRLATPPAKRGRGPPQSSSTL